MGGGFFWEQHQMWLHEKYTWEFCSGCKIDWGGLFLVWSGSFKANRWKELTVFQNRSTRMRKNTSCGYRRGKPQICYKTKQGGGHFVRLIVEISKQQRHTARKKSCCLKGKDGAGRRGTWAATWGGLLLSVLIYPVSREGALCSPGGQVSGGTSHAASSVGEAAVKGRCGKRERVKATPLCASAMEAESLPFITSSTGVLILVTVVFGREDSFWCLLIPENKRKKGCQGNRHPERLTENSG